MLSNVTKSIIEYGNNIAMSFVRDVKVWLSENRNNSLYLYGAGKHLHWVILFLRKYKIPIKMIIDSQKTGDYMGTPIVKFDEFLINFHPLEKNCWFVISAPSAAEKIIKNIRGKFFTANITNCDMQLYSEFITDVEDYRKYLLAHWTEFDCLAESLEDDYSRKTLECILKGRVTSDIYYYKQCYSPEPYYPKDIFSFTDKEVMVELGSYDGETLLKFIELCPKFHVAYAFEPSKEQLPKLNSIKVEQAKVGNRVTIVAKGVWDRIGKMRFAISGSNCDRGSLLYSNCVERYEEIDVTTVDDTVLENISYMKMDIEGSELQALRGAQNQIRKNRPKLAICVYHRPEDILTIYKYLKSLVPDYHFYLRHHNENTGTDTILYAVITD